MKFDLSNTERAAIALAEKNKIDIEEAEKLLFESHICLEASDEIKTSYSLQVAFLSCFNAGNRIFKGGVICNIPDDIPNLSNLNGDTFNEVLSNLFPFSEGHKLNDSTQKILFGKHPTSVNEIELICSGWQGGINIFNSDINSLKNNHTDVCFGACLASSYALFWVFNKTFSMIENLDKESFGYSLWTNSSEYDWIENIHEGPSNISLPSNIWTVGLGHLGQAYVWILANQKLNQGIEILLQDFDTLGKENLGSQLLSYDSQIGLNKTRICADFLTKVGINSKIIEKPFNEFDQQDLALKQFKVLLTGLDNIDARRGINPYRFQVCMDGATNGKLINFDSFTFRNLNLLDKSPKEIWIKEEGIKQEIFHENLYKMVEEKGGCGILTNVGISTPFVGLFGASIIVSELAKNVIDDNKLITFSGKMRTTGSYSIVS